MSPPHDEAGALWFDDEAGPMVRSYTITGGRTRPGDGADVDLIAVIVAAEELSPEADALDDEHAALIALCRGGPLSVVELASEADLPLGVVRVLLGDLLRDNHLHAVRPVVPAELPDPGLLQEVINGLRAL